MGKLRRKDMLTFFLLLPLLAIMLVSCSHDDPATTKTIGGRVTGMPIMLPIPGVTIQVVSSDPDSPCRCECLDDGSVYQTTSDAEGNWTIEDVPFLYMLNEDTQMVMKNQFFLKLTHPNYETSYIEKERFRMGLCNIYGYIACRQCLDMELFFFYALALLEVCSTMI